MNSIIKKTPFPNGKVVSEDEIDWKDLNEVWVITWSKGQGAFHVETVAQMFFRNWDVFYERNPHPSDWIVVGFAQTIKRANEKVEELKDSKERFKSTGEI